jgi:hypothetical protein
VKPSIMCINVASAIIWKNIEYTIATDFVIILVL